VNQIFRFVILIILRLIHHPQLALKLQRLEQIFFLSIHIMTTFVIHTPIRYSLYLQKEIKIKSKSQVLLPILP